MGYRELMPGGMEDAQRYISEVGHKVFTSYASKVYDFLNRLEPGKALPIDEVCNPKNRKLFLTTLWLYRQEGNFIVWDTAVTQFGKWTTKPTVKINV